LTFFSGVVAAQTRPDVGLEVTEEGEWVCESRARNRQLTGLLGHKFHACGSDQGVCAVAVSDDEYPSHVAQQLLRKVINGFCTKYPRTAWASMTKDSKHLSFPELKDHLVNYQDPRNADPISKIQQELDETKIVIHKTINSVLERGEKIDDLVAKSDNLSAQSKMFYTQVRIQAWAYVRPLSLTASPGQEAKFMLRRHVNTTDTSRYCPAIT
jgi:synaptobrevin family protein YKT6